MVIVQRIVCNMMATNCYLFGDDNTREIVIIDPGGEPTAIMRRIEREKFIPKAILLTHGHGDHTGSAKSMRDNYNIPIMYSKKELGLVGIRRSNGAYFVKEPEVIEIGKEKLHILDSPGHSPGGIMLANYDNKIIFTGDTIFQGSIGRTDFGGNFEQLMNTIKEKIINNPKVSDDFILYPGHNEETTVEYEKKHNMFKDYFMN